MKTNRLLILCLFFVVSTTSQAQLLSSGWQRNNHFLDFELTDGYVDAGGIGYTYVHRFLCRSYFGVRGGAFVHKNENSFPHSGTPISTSLEAVAIFHLLGPLNVQVNYGRARYSFLENEGIDFTPPHMRLQLEANVILGRKVMLKYGYNFYGSFKEIRENDWPYKAFVGLGIRL